MIKSVRDAVAARNDIVHVGARGYERAELEEFLEVVSDLLYLFDFCRGQEWALRKTDWDLVEAMRPAG
jgi:hypothetical protein